MADDRFQTAPRSPQGKEPVAHPASSPHRETAAGEGDPAPSGGNFFTETRERLRRLLSPKMTGFARDPHNGREIIETVVFVVVLVLLLKTFAAEAFVIPTGSMATTLWGYQKYVECPRCHYSFPVNCSEQIEHDPPIPVVGCICPNCRYYIDFQDEHIQPDCNSGDRVLVPKYIYDSGLRTPNRLDVVVFKYPEKPEQNRTPTNYIKRLIGLPGETIGIYYGKLYVLSPEDGPKYDDSDAPPQDLWMKEHMHRDDKSEMLQSGDPRFHIIRKSPDKILALRRIVYDNDHPPQDLEGKGFQRWAGDQDGGSWANDEAHGFHHDTGKGDQLQWLRYRNILRPAPGSTSPPEPELITDFIGYNARRSGLMDYPLLPQNWVGDLILDCEAAIDQPEGNLVLELSKGVDRFQARWDLASGVCTLVRLHDGQEEVLDSKPTALKKKGTYRLRFANVDERLTVWVNKDLPFGPEGTNYGPPTQRGPTRNDLQPASVGVKGAAVGIHQLKLWRDTYYTLDPGASDVDAIESLVRDGASGDLDRRQRLHVILSDPDEWSVFHGLKARTLYVQPNPHHYLCLGDNSPESSDGRSWGLVPERLLLGRALVIYYPFLFPSWPFYSPVNRVGAIR